MLYFDVNYSKKRLYLNALFENYAIYDLYHNMKL